MLTCGHRFPSRPFKKGGVNDGPEAIFYGFVVSLGVFRRGKVTFGSVYLKNRRGLRPRSEKIGVFLSSAAEGRGIFLRFTLPLGRGCGQEASCSEGGARSTRKPKP